RTDNNELFIFLTLGAISIFIHAFFFSYKYGRYSGFYLNPNAAGFICISAFSLSYSIKNKCLKSIGRIIALIYGLLTFSRTFILILIIVNFLSLFLSLKNLKYFGIGILMLFLLIIMGEFLNIQNPRFLEIKRIFSSEQVQTNNYNINDDSRTETW